MPDSGETRWVMTLQREDEEPVRAAVRQGNDLSPEGRVEMFRMMADTLREELA